MVPQLPATKRKFGVAISVPIRAEHPVAELLVDEGATGSGPVGGGEWLDRLITETANQMIPPPEQT